jgi:hypothetical protein
MHDNDIRDVMYSSHTPAQLGTTYINMGVLLSVLLALTIGMWPLYFMIYAIITMWW